MSYCTKCGRQLNDTDNVCPICGTPKPGFTPHVPVPVQTSNPNLNGISPRSIVVAIILSFVTCGLYSIYWFICLTDEVNRAAGKPNETSGIVSFLLVLVTCGIYSFIWAYIIGEKCDAITRTNGSSGILYLILTFLGFGIITYALAQNTLNNAIASNR